MRRECVVLLMLTSQSQAACDLSVWCGAGAALRAVRAAAAQRRVQPRHARGLAVQAACARARVTGDQGRGACRAWRSPGDVVEPGARLLPTAASGGGRSCQSPGFAARWRQRSMVSRLRSVWGGIGPSGSQAVTHFVAGACGCSVTEMPGMRPLMATSAPGMCAGVCVSSHQQWWHTRASPETARWVQGTTRTAF